MAVKIRLARRGRAKKPFYHIVVADSRSPRDGKFIEKIGIYNPLTVPATIEIDRDRAFEWLMKGAQPTETARSILRYKGVLFRKHLDKGVKKGAFSQEEADKLYSEFISNKDENIMKKVDKVRQEKEALVRKMSGLDVPIKVQKVEVKKVEAIKEEVVKEELAKEEVVSEEATTVEATTEEVTTQEVTTEEVVSEETTTEEATSEETTNEEK
ncbi:MAG: 30S ribosomal protein S16 [Saprospiraceae bacterium]|nr:30S ribosomal protein S16 [Saprospiraceae bacterium]